MLEPVARLVLAAMLATEATSAPESLVLEDTTSDTLPPSLRLYQEPGALVEDSNEV